MEGGAREQLTVLAERAAAHAAVDDPGAIDWLLAALRNVGAHEQASVLTERLPAAGYFALFVKLSGGEQLRLGRAPDGSAALSWTWNDLG
ncbi:hypothetical protein [Streptomyces sp. NPDC048643]|uniref:hypothetical protein n=1 Tax=Streptomyces sp. NPDC048643 TaxID=3155637 RepID=UPI003443E902